MISRVMGDEGVRQGTRSSQAWGLLAPAQKEAVWPAPDGRKNWNMTLKDALEGAGRRCCNSQNREGLAHPSSPSSL